ncbi:transporter substrate-binding domain-containing protein [Massilia sp. CCM 8695]|uniref:Transporter substrate-binding domain-containing protein n=1 Tax=Massilia frigida TaxID=2609281 RepID=A0ABX0NFB2_9BURK|nr:transporter substrate-binding domain-containing protein [Massilia frigida]
MSHYRMLLKSALLASCLALAAAGAQARIKVIVATDSWAQLMYLDSRKVPKGELADFVNRMNDVQDKFHFELIIYPRLRLDRVFIDKEADVYPLRTTAWTRPELGLLPTKTIFTSGDIYFARRANRFGGHKVFDDLTVPTVAGVRGYHYQLFNNNPDETYIKKNFKAYLVDSNESVIRFVLADHADIGIVPEVIMAKYLNDPKVRQQVIVAGRYDSQVELSNLVRKDGPISVEEMNAIVDLLIASGDVKRLKAKLSIQPKRSPKK